MSLTKDDRVRYYLFSTCKCCWVEGVVHKALDNQCVIIPQQMILKQQKTNKALLARSYTAPNESVEKLDDPLND